MAAEHVFYGENSTGVGGDVMSVTARAAWMVGACAMGPEPVEVNGSSFKVNGRPRRLTAQEQRDEIMRRFERIGMQIMGRTGSGGALEHDPIAGVLNDHTKRPLAAQLLGQAYMNALLLMQHNKDKVEQIAEAVIEKKEIYGDELVALLEHAKLEVPDVDLTDEKVWPVL